MTLEPGDVVNVGAGLPLREIPPVAIEEGIEQDVMMTIETGVLGGLFNGTGFHVNMTSFLDTPGIFSFYGSHLISKAYFSMLEFDDEGNVNLLRHGDTWVGPGGSMDIAEAVADITFCGTMHAGGLRARGADGRLGIESEGRRRPSCSQPSRASCSTAPMRTRASGSATSPSGRSSS